MASFFGIFVLVCLTVIGRKSYRKKKTKEKNLISLEESFDEINELLNSSPTTESKINWEVVNSELLEAEELTKWKENTRSIHTVYHTSDEDVIDLD